MALTRWLIFLLILSTLICLVNAIFMVIICCRGSVKKLKNALLLSLGFSDFSVGFLVIPFNMFCTDKSFRSCGLCVTSYLLNRFVSVSSALHLIAIIYERYLKILHPYWFDSHERTRLRSSCIIPALWLTSLLISATPLAWLLVKMCESEQNTLYTMYYDYACLAFIILLVVLMVYAFARIYLVVRCHLREIRTTHIPQVTIIHREGRDSVTNGRSPGHTCHPPNAVAELRCDSREGNLNCLAGSDTNSQCESDHSQTVSPKSSRYWLIKEARVITRFVAMVIMFIISWGGHLYISTQERKIKHVNKYVGATFVVIYFARSLLNPWIVAVNNRDFHGSWAVLLGFPTRVLARFRRKAADQQRPNTTVPQEGYDPTAIHLNNLAVDR